MPRRTPPPEPGSAPPSVEPPQPVATDTPPALMINIQSWMTPLVGLAMLAVGLAAGYWLRPGGLSAAPTPTPVSEVTATAEPTRNVSAARQAFMDTLIAQTRHFRGDPNAPVTMIEFSDFQ